MTYLKISNNQVYYRITDDSDSSYKTIDKISKEDISVLIDIIMNSDSFDMDEYNSDKIGNTAHNIIYRNLHEKFSNLLNRKEKLIENINSLFSDAYNKYQ